MTEEKKVGFRFEARYYKLGSLNERTREVWFALHGYGHLAQYFIKKFNVLDDKNICVLAPEGLARFYLSELTEQGRKDNKVGATWMTSENRLMDIHNYINYLDEVYRNEMEGNLQIPVTLFGFSQGCATVCRWAATGRVKFERLILWAGIFPPDMDFQAGHDVLEGKKTILVTGKQDPYINEARMKEFEQLESKLGIKTEKIVFDGKHELDEAIINRLAIGH